MAVLLPGVASVAILAYHARAGKVPRRLQLLWVLALAVSYCCARWELTSDMEQLYIYSAFSVVCLLLLFRRVYVSPALAYALTFLSLWLVDVTCALSRALECGAPLSGFYVGVGGAGARDALFLLPLLTAAAVAYATSRIEARGERLAVL
ncbi:MAG TPA: hypothetical protein VMH26_17095 [Burkholderiales bacterium]|nr:hypothetical protein [Burkholderiales bacterium]